MFSIYYFYIYIFDIWLNIFFAYIKYTYILNFLLAHILDI